MSNGVTGGVFANLADLQKSRPRDKTVVELTNGQRFAVRAENNGNGQALENGLFANPVNYVSNAIPNSSADQSDLIQAELDMVAVTGGELKFAAGVYLASGLTQSSGVVLVGQGSAVTEFKVPDGANETFIKSTGFDALVGTNSWLVSSGVQHALGLKKLRINGNKANQTAGYGVQYYAKRIITEDLIIFDCFSDGWYSEAGDIPGQQGWEDLPESRIHLYSRNNNGNGMTFRGPHDSRIDFLVCNENGGKGASFERSVGVYSGSCDVGFAHIYANGTQGYTVNEFNNVRCDGIISESNFGEGAIIDGDNSQISMAQFYNNNRSTGSYQLLLSNTAKGNTISNVQVRDSEDSGGISIAGTNNTISGGLLFGQGSTGTALNIVNTAQRNNVSLTIDNYTVGLSNNGASANNKFDLEIENCGTMFNNGGTSFGNEYGITFQGSGAQVPFTGNQPAVDNSEIWNVRGRIDSTIYLSEDKKQSGADLDLNSTAVQTISASHNLITTPRPEDVSAQIFYSGSNEVWQVDSIYVSNVSSTTVTCKVKLRVAAGAAETGKIIFNTKL